MGSVGLHHVTAIAGNPQGNLDFYTKTLGLRLVKKTVNFDDPGTYHFYYGDAEAHPGSILTFFPWLHVAPGRLGIGETQETVFRVPENSVGYWIHRLVERGMPHGAPVKRFGETIVSFKDPDSMRLALAAVPGIKADSAQEIAGIAAEHAIRGFHSVSLLVERSEATAAILTDALGFKLVGSEGPVTRYQSNAEGAGSIIELRTAGGFLPARMGGGSVHHIAFRAADDAAQAEMVRRIQTEHRLRVTEQKDRNYFRSVYFREPGGILFEIATDIPGFAVDEPLEKLGTALKLPAFLEGRRREIEAMLPPVLAA
jgi:glyoxalase family protein